MHQWMGPSPVAESMAPEVRRPRARGALPRRIETDGSQPWIEPAAQHQGTQPPHARKVGNKRRSGEGLGPRFLSVSQRQLSEKLCRADSRELVRPSVAAAVSRTNDFSGGGWRP